jgi:preprotein translocase subunit SecG
MPKEVKWAISLAVGLGLLALGWKVYFMLVTLHIIICALLIVVIMLQSGEAADLAGAFGGAGSQTAFGPRGAATFLSRATTWCAIVFMMTSLTLSFKRATPQTSAGSILEQTSQPASAPAKPAATPPIQIPVQPTPQQAPAPNPAPKN